MSKELSIKNNSEETILGMTKDIIKAFLFNKRDNLYKNNKKKTLVLHIEYSIQKNDKGKRILVHNIFKDKKQKKQ